MACFSRSPVSSRLLLALTACLLPLAGCPAAPSPQGAETAPSSPVPAEPSGTATPAMPAAPAAAATPSQPVEGWIGVRFRDAEGGGVAVSGVVAGSPADQAQIKTGDLLVALNGKPLPGAGQFADALQFFPAGSTVILKVQSANQTREVSITLTGFDVLAQARTSMAAGVAYLFSQQMESGAFPHFQAVGSEPSAASSALALRALAALPQEMRAPHAEAIARVQTFLDGLVDDHGMVTQYSDRVSYKTYATALYLSALATMADESRADQVGRLRDALISQQLHEPFEVTDYDYSYGSWNYHDANARSSQRADMSITSNVLEALHRANLPADHKAFERARLFLSRTQNWQPDPAEWMKRAMDGGFGFSPRESKAGMDVLPNGWVHYRPYGSSTSDGLRALVYAGHASDAPQVLAARDWLGKHFDLSQNPGLPAAPIPWSQGIYYYYVNSLSDALSSADVSELRDPRGNLIEWEKQLAKELVYRRRGDGSWQNDVNLMSEDDSVLATSFAVWSLARCVARLEGR